MSLSNKCPLPDLANIEFNDDAEAKNVVALGKTTSGAYIPLALNDDGTVKLLASRIPIVDDMSLYTATNVETALEEVMDKVTPVTYVANSIATPTGTVDSGDVTSTQVINVDSYDVSEVTGSPGFDIRLTYTGITVGHEPNKIQLHLAYNGSIGHIVDLEMWNYTGTPQFDVISADFITESGGTQTFYTIDIPGQITDYVSGGEAILRFNHTSAGNVNHDILIDFAALKDDGGGVGGVTEHGALSGLSDDDHTQYLLRTDAISGFVPYTGATGDVDLGTEKLKFGDSKIYRDGTTLIINNDNNHLVFKINDNTVAYYDVITGDYLPGTTSAFSIGDTTLKWKDLHLSGDANIGGQINLNSVGENIITASNAGGDLRLGAGGGTNDLKIDTSGNVDIFESLTVGGNTTTDTLTITDPTVDWKFTKTLIDSGTNTQLGLQSQTSNAATRFGLFTKDGNGEDNNFLHIWGAGTPTNAEGQHRVTLGWAKTPQKYRLNSERDFEMLVGAFTIIGVDVDTGLTTFPNNLDVDGNITMATSKFVGFNADNSISFTAGIVTIKSNAGMESIVMGDSGEMFLITAGEQMVFDTGGAEVTMSNDLNVGGNITVGGTVDGIDIATDVGANTSARHTQNTDTALGSGAVAADHGTGTTDQIINVSYGTSATPPTANTTTEGSIYIQYIA